VITIGWGVDWPGRSHTETGIANSTERKEFAIVRWVKVFSKKKNGDEK